MQNYSSIIFDCDGVLVDSEDLSNQVLIDMAADLGIVIDMDYVHQQFVGKHLGTIFATFEKQIQQPLAANFEQEYRRLTFEAFQQHLQPISGVHSLLEQLIKPFCVASNGPIHKIELNLKHTQLFPFFENKIFSAYQIQKWKPLPDLFLYAAQHMDFEPNDTIVIEDSVVGIEAAIAGGFQVIAFAKSNNIAQLTAAGATQVVFSMQELAQKLL